VTSPATWYFDVISPFAYLSLPGLRRLGAHRPIVMKPVLFAGLLNHWGQLGPAEIAPKRRHIYRQTVFMAERLGLPCRLPPTHPFRPLAILRLLTALGASEAAVTAAFRLVWGEGRDPNDPAVLADVAQEGNDPGAVERIDSPAIKQALADATAAAIAAGVFGVPTLAIDDELFWGLDALPMAEAYLADPALFGTGEYARLDTIAASARRR